MIYELLVTLIGSPPCTYSAFALYIAATALASVFLFSIIYIFISIMKYRGWNLYTVFFKRICIYKYIASKKKIYDRKEKKI